MKLWILPGCVATMLLAGEAAWADCTPAAADNVTATCSGTTNNQAGGAPGTNAGSSGYGTGVETGITVNVVSGAANTVTGALNGIYLDDATVTNNAAASITGFQYGIRTATGFVNVTNSGDITGTSTHGILAGTNATVINNAGAAILGGLGGIDALGFANVTNSGSITGATFNGIDALTNATVTNHAGASIAGGLYGIRAATGIADVTNSGSITGTSGDGIRAGNGATVTNNASASITGGFHGIYTAVGFANVTNSGSITGTINYGVFANTHAMVTNNAGASITGGVYGIYASAAGSSVFNAGTISGATAAIRFAFGGNTLTLTQGSVINGNVIGAGNDTFQLGGAGAATFDISTLSPAAKYQGFGTFNKIDSSIWTLTGISTFSGPVNVNGGALAVNGDMTSAVTVNAGGTLGGNGIVGNTTINAGGALAPGNSIGLLTVRGSLVFTAASSYMIEVSSSNADRVNVTGPASLAGATVNASFATGAYVAKQYTILNATGGLGGSSFGPVVNSNLPHGFKTSLSYDANNAYLNLEIALAQYTGLNTNQQNVANALSNFFNATGGIPLVFGTLTPAGLTQASGEIAVGSQQSTFNAMTLFLGLMTDPLTAGRGNAAGATAFAGDALNAYARTGRKRGGPDRDAHDLITKVAPRGPPFEARWNVWAAGFGGSQTTDGHAATGSNTAVSRIGGVAAGADYWLSPQTIAGFALAGGGTSFSVANGGSGRSDLFQAGALLRHAIGAAYMTAAVAYGWQDITTDRAVTVAGIDHLRARFNANAFSGRVEAGHRYVMPWMGGVGFTPYAAAQVTAFDLPAYAESIVSGASTFALAHRAKTVTATRSEIGLRSDESYAVNDAVVTLRGSLAWAHNYDTDRNIAATFQALPGASFVVNGAAPASEAALTTASAEIKYFNGVSLAAIFEGEFSGVTRSYAGKGVARYNW